MRTTSQDSAPSGEHARSFCLLPDAGGAENDSASSPDWSESLVVPPGRSFFVRPADGPPRIVTCIDPGDHRWCALEPIQRERSFQLLIAAGPGASFQANGIQAPPLVLLEERDVVTFDEGRASFYLSIYVRPYVGPLQPEHESLNCSFCQTPLSTGHEVYVCPFCGAPAHSAPADDGCEASQRLECATHMQSCSQCLNPVHTAEGLTYVPEEVLSA